MSDTPAIELVDECEEILAFYRDHPEQTLKTLVCRAYAPAGKEYIAVVTRGDLAVDFDEISRELGLTKVRLANRDEMERLGLVTGYVSPIDCQDMKVLVDRSLEDFDSYYDGANRPQGYRRNVSYPRDFDAWRVFDFGVEAS